MAAMMCMNIAGAKTVKKVVAVDGACGMCEQRIEKAAKAVSGVVSAEWNKNTKKLSLVYDNKKTSVEAVQKALAAAGHDSGDYKAPAKVYASLPACCKYRGNAKECNDGKAKKTVKKTAARKTAKAVK